MTSESPSFTSDCPADEGTTDLDDVFAEVRRRLQGVPFSIGLLVRTVHDVTLEWTREGRLARPVAEILRPYVAAVRLPNGLQASDVFPAEEVTEERIPPLPVPFRSSAKRQAGV